MLWTSIPAFFRACRAFNGNVYKDPNFTTNLLKYECCETGAMCICRFPVKDVIKTGGFLNRFPVFNPVNDSGDFFLLEKIFFVMNVSERFIKKDKGEIVILCFYLYGSIILLALKETRRFLGR